MRWGYHRAALLGPYTLERRDGRYDITAEVRFVNDFQLRQDGLSLHVEEPAQFAGVFPIASASVSNSTFTAALGARQESACVS